MRFLPRILAWGFFLLFVVVLIVIFLPQKKIKKKQSVSIPNNILPVQQSLFVPYWEVSKKQLPSSYSTYLYFGVSADGQGVRIADDGYRHVTDFIDSVPQGKKKLLVVRLVDTKFNIALLQNNDLQKKISNQVSSLAKDNGFFGTVIDMEVSALGFDSVTNGITQTLQTFAQSAKQHKLSFGVMLYGDTFYRLRPYDASKISSFTDSFYIMAYDLHKANGDPGPNFPLQDDDYDFKKMIGDFSYKISKEKIIVVYGLFGYDWQLNNKGISLGQGQAMSLYQIHNTFFPRCRQISCTIDRNKNAKEIEITYKDNTQHTHQVWFEDMESVKQKTIYLQTQHIHQIGLWAYGYF